MTTKCDQIVLVAGHYTVACPVPSSSKAGEDVCAGVACGWVACAWVSCRYTQWEAAVGSSAGVDLANAFCFALASWGIIKKLHKDHGLPCQDNDGNLGFDLHKWDASTPASNTERYPHCVARPTNMCCQATYAVHGLTLPGLRTCVAKPPMLSMDSRCQAYEHVLPSHLCCPWTHVARPTNMCCQATYAVHGLMLPGLRTCVAKPPMLSMDSRCQAYEHVLPSHIQYAVHGLTLPGLQTCVARLPMDFVARPLTDLRCQAYEREDSDIILHADDEDKPQAKRKVLDVSDADLLLRPTFFASEYLLRTPVK